MSGPHVCNIGLCGYDRRGEWVEIANSSNTVLGLTGLKITDYTATQQDVHIYTFPPAVGGATLTLAPGASAFVSPAPDRASVCPTAICSYSPVVALRSGTTAATLRTFGARTARSSTT
jgi:hypothetical protein